MNDKLIPWGWQGKNYLPNLWVKYRLTSEKFNKIWDEQEGKCAGCAAELAHPFHKRALFGLRPEVDHDHTTSGDNTRVRGLLCRDCNMFLGKIKDNQQRLHNLAAYLRRNGEDL